MAEQSRLDSALNKFDAAMRALEGAAVRTRQKIDSDKNAQAEAATMLEDRSRLAAELDRAKAQLSELAANKGEADKKIDAAMTTIKSVLEK
ncbi:MAG: DUF4164 family protein [Hyphomicrobiales bacterium]